MQYVSGFTLFSWQVRDDKIPGFFTVRSKTMFILGLGRDGFKRSVIRCAQIYG